MKDTSTQLLKTVKKAGELPLSELIAIGKMHGKDHISQYPLTWLIEDGFLGITSNHTPPPRAENMREYCRAIEFHMHTLPTNEYGERKYLQVTSSGSLESKDIFVFLKAKGYLYLEERIVRFQERILSVIVGVIIAIVTAAATRFLELNWVAL